MHLLPDTAADQAAVLLPLLLLVPVAAATHKVALALEVLSAAQVPFALLRSGAALSASPVDVLRSSCQTSALTVVLLLHSSCQH